MLIKPASALVANAAEINAVDKQTHRRVERFRKLSAFTDAANLNETAA
jgi:hypothetical protein